MKIRLCCLLVLVVTLLVACDKKTPPTLVPTAPAESSGLATRAPTSTRATTASEATAAPWPTATTSATRTPRPTRTARPTPTASATPIPGPSPSGPIFPPNVNPLTGLEVADEATLERCPLAIKVSNAPAVVRPQAGLDQADLVFEHYAEGGVTRLTAVFLGQDPAMVGSVRSGRLIDLEIPAMFQAIFAYSGSSAGVGEKYKKSDLWPDQIASPWSAGSAFYRRDLDKAYEHTLFVDPAALWVEAERRGISGRQDLDGWIFDEMPPLDGRPAADFQILYLAGISQVEWVYNETDGRYYRWQGGAKHTEELTGQQLSAANVIVVGANHVETNIVEDTWGGGHYSIEVQVWGEGPISIFRDGQRYDGIWRRPDRHKPLTFWTLDGSQQIALKPGNSWFQMVPLGFTGLVELP